MAKIHAKFVCQQCGYNSPKWLGRCPDCDQWNTFVEEAATPVTAGYKREIATLYTLPRRISEIEVGAHHRRTTGIGEFDRVLGGGIVSGSVVLIGGDPGIGKSTLLTQVAGNISSHSVGAGSPCPHSPHQDDRAMGRDQTGNAEHRTSDVQPLAPPNHASPDPFPPHSTLYISGEESQEQIKLRAERLGINTNELYLASETNIDQVEACISLLKPGAVIIDSIQTMYDPSLESAPATVGQVRSCTSVLTRIAKSMNIPVFIVGHVTKEGAIAGPRVLEHMVDTVLYFEGDRHQTYRILRAVKNRFGSTDELGIFEMREQGLMEVANPSETLISERAQHRPGSVVAATIEGTRPLLVEVQALVAPSYFSAPRRMATGVDYNRTMLILAVLEKRVGLSLANQDVYVNIAGGVKIVEPAVDLAIAIAVASNLKETPVDPKTMVIGEVGLAGEVRSVSQVDKRIKEASRLGFERAIVPGRTAARADKRRGIQVIGVDSVYRAVEAAIGEFRRRKTVDNGQ